MEETKIEQVEATPEVEAPAEAVAEAPAETEAVVAEGCDCGDEKCDADKEAGKAKKEPEDDEKETKVEEGLQAEHDAKQRKEVEKEQSKDLLEAMEERASEKVALMVTEAVSQLPIQEGMSEEEYQSLKEGIYKDGARLMGDIMDVIEEVVAGTTMDLNGHQVEVKDFYEQGGKVGMTAPAGADAPVKAEDDEEEKKVKINAYHEGYACDKQGCVDGAKLDAEEKEALQKKLADNAKIKDEAKERVKDGKGDALDKILGEGIDYKSKYAESEAVMDDLVSMIEGTADKYNKLAESYKEVVKELQAYKLSEAYSILKEDATKLLESYSYSDICEEFDRVESGEEVIVEEEQEAGKKDEVKEEPKAEEEKKEEAKEDKKEEKEEKKEEAPKAEEVVAVEEIKESLVEDQVIAEAVTPVKAHTFSVFKREEISESKPARKAWSAFAD